MSKEHGSLVEGLSQVTCPVMVVGVKSDILFPIMQQQELADTLLESGNGLNYCTKTLYLLCFKFSATWPLSRNK